jgi:hypothetical protein
MQIFGLSSMYTNAAMKHCDKHVVKQCTECAQLLFAALYRFNRYRMPPQSYKEAYKHHPLTWWVAGSRKHFDWTLRLGIKLCDEFKLRYGHDIRTREALQRIKTHVKTHGYPRRMPTGAPSPHRWQAWVERMGGQLKEVRTASVNPPKGCKFGLVAIDKTLPVEVDDDWVATYARYYKYKEGLMQMTNKRERQVDSDSDSTTVPPAKRRRCDKLEE